MGKKLSPLGIIGTSLGRKEKKKSPPHQKKPHYLGRGRFSPTKGLLITERGGKRKFPREKRIYFTVRKGKKKERGALLLY